MQVRRSELVVVAYRVRARHVMDPGRVLRGDGLQPPAVAVVGEGRAGTEADGLFAVPDGLDVQRRRGPGVELAVDGVQRVAGRRPRREPPDLAGAPARHLQELAKRQAGRQQARQLDDALQLLGRRFAILNIRGAFCSRRREPVLPVAVEEESRRRRPCPAAARRQTAAPSPRALTRATRWVIADL